jgi:phytoene dehydrogenase-like protein
MDAHPTALVIGAGLGGIATAARLTRAGFNVRVLEKQEAPGGRCSQLVRDGHRFDIGATLFLMPEVFAETFTALGERMEDHLDLRRIDPTYRLRFEDGTQLVLTSDLNALQAQVEAIEPGSFGALLRYLVEGHQSYHLYPQLGTHNVFLAGDYRTSFGRIFTDHLLPDEPSFYVHAPARTDPSAAPTGEDTLMVLIPAGHLDTGIAQDWDALQSRARSAVIHRLAASMGIAELRRRRGM